MTTITILAAIHIALQVADAISTIVAIRGGAFEANPFLRWLADYLSSDLPLIGRWAWLLVAKLLAALAILYIAMTGGDLAIALLFILAIVYAVIISGNLRLIRKQRSRQEERTYGM